jgi:hypothetical protein
MRGTQQWKPAVRTSEVFRRVFQYWLQRSAGNWCLHIHGRKINKEGTDYYSTVAPNRQNYRTSLPEDDLDKFVSKLWKRLCEHSGVVLYRLSFSIWPWSARYVKYKVVQICPGLVVCKQVTVCPGHIWTTLYIYYDEPLLLLACDHSYSD